jgi:hypothetical protein
MKAPVLPLPVRLCTIMSRPANRYGMAVAWTGMSLLQPACWQALRKRSGKSSRVMAGKSSSG